MRFAIAALTLTACSYDWTVAAVPADAGDASLTDAAIDAKEDALATDSSAADASPDAAACMTLLADVAAKRAAAKSCQSVAMECTTTVTDECGCTQVVAEANSAYGAYKDAIAAYAASCSKPSACPTTCPTFQTGLCVVADGGPSLACKQ